VISRRGFISSGAAGLVGAISSQAIGQTLTDKLHLQPDRMGQLYAKLDTIYQNTVQDALKVFRIDLTVTARMEKSDTNDLSKFAPLVIRDEGLDQQGFYNDQPVPLIEAVDTFMPSHYLALAKMRHEIKKMKIAKALSDTEYQEADARIMKKDPSNPVGYRISDHGIWYGIDVANVKSTAIRQGLWCQTKDPQGREVEVRVSRLYLGAEAKRADGVKYLDQYYENAAPIIHARYVGAKDWTEIMTTTMKGILDAHAAQLQSEANAAANPIPGTSKRIIQNATKPQY
jgi:hypothetical protein